MRKTEVFKVMQSEICNGEDVLAYSWTCSAAFLDAATEYEIALSERKMQKASDVCCSEQPPQWEGLVRQEANSRRKVAGGTPR